MADQSYSAWFLRFTTAFHGPRRRFEEAGASHQDWLKVFVEAFRGARADTEDAADWQLREDAGTERSDWNLREDTASDAESYQAQQQPRTEERQRYTQSGGEDVET